MQNRYVADIGDYVKLAILRTLAPNRKLGVVWWIFPDESHNADGRHREYLKDENKWKHFDQDLFDALLKIEKTKNRDVCALEKAAVLQNAVFVSDPVPCEVRPFSRRPEARRQWLEGVKVKLKDCDLVFLDPDNGIASERLKLTWRRAGKSVKVDEMKGLQENNRAMVVYHHQTRYSGGHSLEIFDLAKRLKSNGLHVSGALRAGPFSPRIFFIINGDNDLHERAKRIEECWGNKISWYPDI